MSRSFDSGNQPLNHQYQYQAANNPYSTGGYDSSPFLGTQKKQGTSKWIKFGIPAAVVIIAAAVVGGIVGSRHKSSSSGGSGSSDSAAAASSAVNNKNDIGVFATATDSYGLPVYPTTSNAAYVAPTFVANAKSAWPTNDFNPANPAPTNLRTDRPRLIAPKYKWDALPNLVANDPYMKQWNDTIMGNATFYKSQALVPYDIDGGLTLSGVLDVARQVKERIKAYAYAFRVTGDQGWVNRCWDELQNAAGNSSQSFGTRPDNWNSQHFLDLAEFTAAFAIGYDWLYDQWSDDQKSKIMWSILELGLSFGVQAYNGAGFAWWRLPENGQGNWNCVCNSGLTMGALAILGDDPTGMAASILSNSIPNAVQNCATAPTTDGSWTETANYWYFGTTAHSEMTASLLTAAGGDFGLLNGNFNGTAFYHMYITGMTSLFNYGDHGPNKYSTTANGMMFYATHYSEPRFMLFQRDQRDAWSDPFAMFNYDPTVVGAWWDGLALDHFFDDPLTQWASMRSTWSSNDGMYVAMKAGNNTGAGHQNHNDLDVGDFVLDAMGQRWAGELGSGDYDAPGYFDGAAQDDPRWLYYRKRTEGQNTIVLGQNNQNIFTGPTVKHDTTGEVQDSTTSYTVPKTSTAFFTADITSAYPGQANSMKRGIRFLNSRKQVLLQDDVDTTADLEWRMHTNASVALDSDTQTTLTLADKTMKVMLLSPSGAKWTTLQPTRYPNDPPLPKNTDGSSATDQPNPNVTVLAIQLSQGQNQIQVLFNPQWEGMSDGDFVSPPTVAIDSWSLTSHN